ncbi:hypothetical protein E1287_25770 [Actinomadura sp. KC06]|uniref:hypothetical protein n=1 Tax=Actinomadura sp. KC06 TaxID=2530369 RepID=UPI001050E83C|nr:hypothetical protein [Actinomadura sp. KC06]TDD31672.1 hypothetical protein E1287_25770 [Actinomadura sp. KC06]
MAELTPERRSEGGRLIERAHEEIAAICKDGPSRWRMSIPAQPDRDSDLILSAGLKAGGDLLAEVERLRAELEAAREMIGDALVALPGRRSWEQLRDDILANRKARDEAQDLVGQRARERAEADRRANGALKLIEKAEAERDDAEQAARAAQAHADQMRAERDRLRTLLGDMVDPNPCTFDHHGGCQEHGYLSLQPGEKCPHAGAKEVLALDGTEVDRDA